MVKRIIAWVLLAGFVFLILNIIVLHFYLQLSVVIYLVIMFGFLLSGKNRAGFWKADVNHEFGKSSDAGDMEQDTGNTTKMIGDNISDAEDESKRQDQK